MATVGPALGQAGEHTKGDVMARHPSARRVITRVALVVVAGVAVLPAGRAIGAPVSSGDQLWVSTLNDPADNTDQANAVAVSPDGSKVFVTGYSSGSTGIYDYTTAAYDAVTGSPLWVQRYDGPGHGYDTAKAVAVSADGSKVFVTGGSDGIGGYEDIATIAYDAGTGSKLWLARYDGSSHKNDWGLSIAASPDGSKVFVAGYSNAVRDDFTVVGYDAAAGSQQWVRTYNGPGTDRGDRAEAVTVSPDGSQVFATGFSAAGSTNDFTTVALDAATGGPIWLKTYDGPGHNSDSGFAIAASPDGTTVFVTGDSLAANFYNDYATIAYDSATGTRKWLTRYNGPAGKEDESHSLGVSPDGLKVFVTGLSTGVGTGYDYATNAYDAATGKPLWSRRYDGPGSLDDVADALGVSPDGSKVFVTGYSAGPTGLPDYATQAYDAGTGAVLWESRFDGPAHDYDAALSLAVGPDGSNVFVTGYSYSTATADDWATVAYQA